MAKMNKLPSVRKILQALYYIQSNAPSDNNDRFNKVYLLKMFYFADRYHLRHFGCLASRDTYFAMKLGPVASTAYNILKRDQCNINSAEVGCLQGVKEVSEHDVEIEFQGDDELSKSFKKALDFALKEFGHYSWSQQSDISHCYPEWKNLYGANPSNLRTPMDLRDFFDDPDDNTCFSKFGKNCDPFKDDKEFLTLLREDLNAIPD
jgi:uncharacterized phage-associated protein